MERPRKPKDAPALPLSLTESAVTLAILVLGLAPAFSLTLRSCDQRRTQRVKAAVARIAEPLLEQLITQVKFEDACAGKGDFPFKGERVLEQEDLAVRWSIETLPVGTLSFQYQRPKKHPPHPGGEVDEPALQEAPGGTNTFTVPAHDLEPAAPGCGGELLEIRMSLQWKSGGESYKPERSVTLWTRKARLE